MNVTLLYASNAYILCNQKAPYTHLLLMLLTSIWKRLWTAVQNQIKLPGVTVYIVQINQEIWNWIKKKCKRCLFFVDNQE